MAVEVEIKLKIDSVKTLSNILRELGFAEAKRVVEKDLYFTSKERDLWKRDEALRIRRVKDLKSGEEMAELTFKGKKMDDISMTRQELECSIANPDIVQEILEGLGFYPVPAVEKERQYFSRGNVTACLDRVQGLGNFLELEILTDSEDNREEALNRMEDLLKKLGYSMKDTTRTSYLSMLLAQL